MTEDTMKITKEEYLEAIRDGISEAVLAALPTKKEILQAITYSMPCEREINEAIAKGVYDSFPWPSEILNAIGRGTERAHGLDD